MERQDVMAARIASLRELGNVIDAMRSLAAARLAQAQEALAGAHAYAGIVDNALAEALRLGQEPPRHRESPGLIVVALLSEHGFVGDYNRKIIDEVGKTSGRQLFLLGARGGVLAREMGLHPAGTSPMVTRIDDVSSQARHLAEKLKRTPSRVQLVSARIQPGQGYRVVRCPLMPPVLPPPSRPSNAFPPLHTLPPTTLVDRLAELHLFAELVHALTEALAAENQARVLATNGAHENIDRKLEELRTQERALRQEAITTELLDIVAGAEVLMNASKP